MYCPLSPSSLFRCSSVQVNVAGRTRLVSDKCIFGPTQTLLSDWETGSYLPGDWLLFGAETTGLPIEVGLMAFRQVQKGSKWQWSGRS